MCRQGAWYCFGCGDIQEPVDELIHALSCIPIESPSDETSSESLVGNRVRGNENMKIEQQRGAWIRKASLVGGERGRIVGEAKLYPGKFGEKLGVPLSIDGGVEGVFQPTQGNIALLVDAFSDETKSWIGKRFVTEMRDITVRNMKVRTPFLIPDKQAVLA